ncbi:MAG: RHS repeat domain-containing protein, partial [Pseudomonadota bacterium]
QGNAIAYTLDAMGNRTAERVYGAGASLVQQLTREYSSVNRLTKLIGGTNPAGQVTQYAYDAQGNLTSVTDPLNRVTANAYDALNRLVTVTDPANGVTAFGYTPLDQLASVTDPRNLVTRYTRNALDELTSQLSPDTGTTTNTFDAAGNVLASTDARGVVTSATYDALNRVTSQTFTPPGGSGIAPVAIGYGYDGGATGNGRLTSVADPSGSITFTYDAHGRLTQDARVIGGIAYPTAYRYNSAGRRDRITYPSGTVVDFSFDALGRIAGITATPAAGSASTILTGAAYHPFGALKDFTHGHGAAYSRSFDLDGRISAHTLGAGTRTITWDEASRLSAFAGPSPGLDQTMGYDALDRLTDWVSSVSSQRYSYDASGNRTRLTLGANSYPYTVSTTSNRLTHTAGPGGSKTFGFDAAGHTTAAGTLAFAYDARGRMIQAVNGSLTATYQLNALGQRVVKTLSPGATTHFHYDAEGHLIAESDAAGAVQREYLWLGDTPVALITHPDQAVYFLQPDHLNTPRVVTNAANAIVWRWDSDPFGVTPPDPDPDGDSNQFVFNLRLPGQYYDKETNTHYNMMRDYDPGIGRYIQPEPLGLAGDINLYRYARSNPLTYYDPDGAQAIPMPGLPPIGIPSPWNPKPRKSDNIFDPPAKPTGLPWPLSLLIPKSDLDKCKDECDDVLQREEADCEWRYKMGGRRDREGVRSCLQMARDRWVQCYRKCEDENRCR